MAKRSGDQIEFTVKYNYTCCICLERARAPIMSCGHMHIVCGECKKNIDRCTGCKNKEKETPCDSCKYVANKCPVCREQMIRNSALEKILEEFLIPCDNNLCRARVYPEDLEEHKQECPYTDIRCLWCNKKTDPLNLPVHCSFDCEMKFCEMGSGEKVDWIKSKKINNVYIRAEACKSRCLYIFKDEKLSQITFTCIQTEDYDSEDVREVVISYGETKSQKLAIPLNTRVDLIAGRIKSITINNENLAKMENLRLSHFTDKYRVGSRWIFQDNNEQWFTGVVIKRKFNPSSVDVKYDRFPDPKHNETIETSSGRIRDLDNPPEDNQRNIVQMGGHGDPAVGFLRMMQHAIAQMGNN